MNTSKTNAKIQRRIRHPAAPLIEVRNLLKMQMADEPDDRHAKRDHQHQKNYSAFAPFFPKRFSSATGSSFVAPAFILERDRNIEPAASFARAGEQFLTLTPRRFLRHARRFCNHPLEFFHLAAQLRFSLREFFLFLIERRPGLRSRSAAHAELLDLLRHPKENDQRQDPESDERQSDGEADLQPLRERFPTEARGP